MRACSLGCPGAHLVPRSSPNPWPSRLLEGRPCGPGPDRAGPLSPQRPASTPCPRAVPEPAPAHTGRHQVRPAACRAPGGSQPAHATVSPGPQAHCPGPGCVRAHTLLVSPSRSASGRGPSLCPCFLLGRGGNPIMISAGWVAVPEQPCTHVSEMLAGGRVLEHADSAVGPTAHGQTGTGAHFALALLHVFCPHLSSVALSIHCCFTIFLKPHLIVYRIASSLNE